MSGATSKLREGTETMEFSVKKYDLLEELEMTQGVVERKTTIPILSNLLFEGQGGKLLLTATDLELSICTSCEAKIKKEGSGTIPAKKLLELARLLSGLISRTLFAISVEESRYTLNGGLLIIKPEMAAMVATDGHRLALAESDHKFAGLNNEVRVLVPKKALAEIQRLAADAGEDGTIEFARDDSYLFFQ